MLANYDARAVAEVLGIAGAGGSDGGAPPNVEATGAAAARGHVPPSGEVPAVGGEAPDRFVGFHAEPGGDLDDSVVPTSSPLLIERAVERGLPRSALRRVAEHLAGGDRARVVALERGLVPKTTLDRRERQLSPEESERTERVARLFVHARRTLGTEAEAREFLTTPHPRLEGRTPLDASRTDLGTRRVEALLNALEHGLAL